MDDRVTEIVDAVRSGDADRVNDAIDRIEDLDFEDRARLFDAGFDEFTDIYAESDDGYVRQSVVRVVNSLSPGMVVAVKREDEGYTDDDLETRLDAACGFLLEAIQDEDGRVRQAAKRGLQDVYRSYMALDDTETITTLIAELERLADTYEDDRQKHLLESKEDAEHLVGPVGSNLVESIQELAARSNEFE